jgi:hypothetical protein
MLNLERNFDITTPGNNITDYRDQLQNTIDDLPSDSINCYTDGSRSDTGCGAGYIITSKINVLIFVQMSRSGNRVNQVEF